MNVFGERQNPEKYIPMVIKKVRDNKIVTVHANSEKTKAGSRHYIHAEDVANALLFLFNYDFSHFEPDETGAKCQKFNIVDNRQRLRWKFYVVLKSGKFILRCSYLSSPDICTVAKHRWHELHSRGEKNTW